MTDRFVESNTQKILRKKKENTWRRRFYPIELAFSRPLRIIEKNIESNELQLLSPLATLIAVFIMCMASLSHIWESIA